MAKGFPTLRGRHYTFAIAVFTVIFHIGALTTGGWGYFWLWGVITAILFSAWTTTCLGRIAAPHIIWFGGSASLGPRAMFAVLPAIIDEKGVELWPESEIYALGGGEIGGLTIGATGEFLICRRGLAIPTASPGKTIPNYFINGWARELSRPDDVRYRLYGQVRPHLLDPRTRLPEEWAQIYTKHRKWDWIHSVIWVVDMPVHPYLMLSEAGHFQLHAEDGRDPIDLRKLLPKLDAAAPQTVLLDLVHLISGRSSSEAAGLRAELAEYKNASRAGKDHVTGILAGITDVETKVAGRGMLTYVTDLASADNDSAEGVSRQQ